MRRQLGSPIVGPSGAVLPLSAGVEIDGIIYLSGQLAMAEGRIVGSDIGAQTGTAIDGIAALLATAGLSLADIFKVTVWITRRSDFAGFNAVYAERFGPVYPVRSTVVSELVAEGALVEIEAIACRSAAA